MSANIYFADEGEVLDFLFTVKCEQLSHNGWTSVTRSRLISRGLQNKIFNLLQIIKKQIF